jgi:hypothetical protein
MFHFSFVLGCRPIVAQRGLVGSCSQYPENKQSGSPLSPCFYRISSRSSSTAHSPSRRRHLPQKHDPPKPRFIAFLLRSRSTRSKKRLSNESWVSPLLPALGTTGSPLSQDLELRRYAFPKRKLVPGYTPTEFGSRLEFANGYPGSVISVSPVRVPSPVPILPLDFPSLP